MLDLQKNIMCSES